MERLLIKGKKILSGNISISGSKNATLPILAATILSRESEINNIPLVKDVFTTYLPSVLYIEMLALSLDKPKILME